MASPDNNPAHEETADGSAYRPDDFQAAEPEGIPLLHGPVSAARKVAPVQPPRGARLLYPKPEGAPRPASEQ